MAKRALNDQKRGDLGINEVYQGDCLQLMKRIPEKTVDFVLTDPPYGIDFRSFRLSKREDGGRIANDSFEDWKRMLPGMFSEFKRVLTATGCCACFNGGGNKSLNTSIFIMEAVKYFHLEQVLVWRKNMGLGWRYRPAYETIVVLSNGENRYNFYDTSRKCVNVIEGINQIIPKAGDHPTPKPVRLLRRLLEIHSIPGQLVLDPFAGGGSTGVACKQMGRNYILMELEARYCDMARNRIAKAEIDVPAMRVSALRDSAVLEDFELVMPVNKGVVRATPLNSR